MELDDCAFPLVDRHRGHLRPQDGLRRHLLGPAGRLRSPARRAWSAATCSPSTAASSSPRAGPSPRTPPPTCGSWWWATPATPTASSPAPTPPRCPADRWFAMTRLDENRAKAQLAHKAGVPVASVHQRGHLGQPLGHPVPRLRQRHDRRQAGHRGHRRPRVAPGRLHHHRAEARRGHHRGPGLSSAASAANAAIDSVVALRTATAPGDCVSLAVASSGEYGAPEGLQFGFPVVADGRGGWSVVEGFDHDEFARGRIDHHRGAGGRAGRRAGARPHRLTTAGPGSACDQGLQCVIDRSRAVKRRRNTALQGDGGGRSVRWLRGRVTRADADRLRRDGRPRRRHPSPYAGVASSLSQMGPEDVSARATRLARAFMDQGVTFDLDGEERPFPLDVVPRIFTAAEWTPGLRRAWPSGCAPSRPSWPTSTAPPASSATA